MNGAETWTLPPAPSAGSIKVAHLTDPHLSNLAGIEALELRDQRLLGWLSWRRKRRRVHQRATLDAVVAAARRGMPDHWCITGDLTHIGHERELSEAAEWLRSLAPPGQLTVIPGNHDLYIPACSQAALEVHWGPYLKDAGDAWPRLQLRGAVALISLNSGHAAPPAFATGALGALQRTRLKACLAAAGAAGYARLVLIHHAPGPGRRPGVGEHPSARGRRARAPRPLPREPVSHPRRTRGTNPRAQRALGIGHGRAWLSQRRLQRACDHRHHAFRNPRGDGGATGCPPSVDTTHHPTSPRRLAVAAAAKAIPDRGQVLKGVHVHGGIGVGNGNSGAPSTGAIA